MASVYLITETKMTSPMLKGNRKEEKLVLQDSFKVNDYINIGLTTYVASMIKYTK